MARSTRSVTSLHWTQLVQKHSKEHTKMNLLVNPLPPQDEGLEFPYSSLPHLAAWIGRMEADPAVLQYSLPQQVH